MRWGGLFVDGRRSAWRVVKCDRKAGKRVYPPRDRRKRCGGDRGFLEAEELLDGTPVPLICLLELNTA